MTGNELITPDDLLRATRLFKSMNSNLELRESSSGVKIIQLKVSNEEEDFRKYCGEPIRSRHNGVSVDDLVKVFGLSRLVARDKLQTYSQQGRLVADSSVEGVRYYINDIVTCQFD